MSTYYIGKNTYCCYLLSIFWRFFVRVGRPVPSIRFSGPRGTGAKSGRHVWWSCCVLYMRISKLLHNVSSLVKGQERSALKISQSVIAWLFSILANRWMSSEVEVDLTFCLDIDCRSTLRAEVCSIFLEKSVQCSNMLLLRTSNYQTDSSVYCLPLNFLPRASSRMTLNFFQLF